MTMVFGNEAVEMRNNRSPICLGQRENLTKNKISISVEAVKMIMIMDTTTMLHPFVYFGNSNLQTEKPR